MDFNHPLLRSIYAEGARYEFPHYYNSLHEIREGDDELTNKGLHRMEGPAVLRSTEDYDMRDSYWLFGMWVSEMQHFRFTNEIRDIVHTEQELNEYIIYMKVALHGQKEDVPISSEVEYGS